MEIFLCLCSNIPVASFGWSIFAGKEGQNAKVLHFHIPLLSKMEKIVSVNEENEY
jgi:hypothetical protein